MLLRSAPPRNEDALVCLTWLGSAATSTATAGLRIRPSATLAFAPNRRFRGRIRLLGVGQKIADPTERVCGWHRLVPHSRSHGVRRKLLRTTRTRAISTPSAG